MFTGLIEGLGIIKPLDGYRFQLDCADNSANKILADLAIGDSVAVDGVCLTVEEILPKGFVADASPETLRRTTLGQRSLAVAYVNLETSIRVGSKLGGHFVSGHVDGIGCLQESLKTANSWEMFFTAPTSYTEQWQRHIARYIVPKGSVAVNGVSLTVADCDASSSWFKVAVIPHSFKETNLSHLELGSWVNIEGDILGKYVEKLLSFKSSAGIETITSSFLAEHGYL